MVTIYGSFGVRFQDFKVVSFENIYFSGVKSFGIV